MLAAMAFQRFVYHLLLTLSFLMFVSLFLFGSYLFRVDDVDEELRIEPKQAEQVLELKETLPFDRHSLDVARQTKCLHLSSPAVCKRSSCGVLVFTRCNRQAALYAEAIWRTGRSLLFVSESDCLQRPVFKSTLSGPLLHTLSVVAIDHCNASSLAAEISSRDVGEVHVIIERDDFREGDSPHDLGDLQRCYVSLLEAMRSNRQAALFFHAHGHTAEVQSANHQAAEHTGSDATMCSYNYDANHYGDVMKFILFMYSTVYASLYEFKHIYLAAGPWVEGG